MHSFTVKRKIYFIVILQFFSLQMWGQKQILFDNFDSDKNWDFTGGSLILNSTSFPGSTGNYISNSEFMGYSDNLSEELISKSLDLRGYQWISLDLDIWYHTENGYDGVNIQYSISGGTWKILGAIGEGVNWYNQSGIDGISGQSGWSEEKETWLNAKLPIPAILLDQQDVKFKIVFGSDYSENRKGMAIDNFNLSGLKKPISNTSNLVFWNRADLGFNGGSWIDQSGNGNSANISSAPLQINSPDFNNQKVLAFTNDGLNIPNNHRINAGAAYQGDERSMNIAFKTGGNVNTCQYLYEQGGSTNGIGGYIENGKLYVNIFNDDAANRISVNQDIQTNYPYILSFVWDNGILRAKLNGADFTNSDGLGGVTNINQHSGDISIGYTAGTTRDANGTRKNAGNYFNGEIAELLYFDKALSEAEVDDVNNYLALRYGISFDVETFYSYQSGDWDNYQTWTKDPSGTTQTGRDIPSDGDKVIILKAREVNLTKNIASKSLDLTIQEGGILNQASHQFTEKLSALRGQGIFRLASVNIPDINIAPFMQANGGTVEFTNTSNFNLPITQKEYCHLWINTNNTAIQKSNIKLNGNLRIKRGSYQINDGTAAKRELTILGNVQVDAGASFTVGAGRTTTTNTPTAVSNGGTPPFINYYDQQSHRLVVNGDFINNGTVRFTSRNYPVFNQLPSDGIVSLYFQGANNSTFLCNGKTYLYNLILDKGIDQTYSLTINSTAYSNFKLMGANNAAGDRVNASTENPNLKKALWIRTGSLHLKGLTVIPSLTEGNTAEVSGTPGSEYIIPEKAAFIIDGSDVIVLSSADDYREVNLAYSGTAPSTIGVTSSANQEFVVYGKFEVNDGYFSTRETAGIKTKNYVSGQIEINGGFIDTKQLQLENGGSFSQSGGKLELRGRFQRTTSSFSNINDLINAPLNTNRPGASLLNNARASFSLKDANNVFILKGGELSVLDASGATGNAFEIHSDKANINVSGGTLNILPRDGSGTNATNLILKTKAPVWNLNIDKKDGSTGVLVDVYNLSVESDLNLQSGVLEANAKLVSVGGTFNIAKGTTFRNSDKLRFYGDKKGTFNINLDNPLALKKLELDKNKGTELLLGGSQKRLDISDSLIVKNAILNTNTTNLGLKGHVYNSGELIGDGELILNAKSDKTIEGDGSGVFTNLRLKAAKSGSVDVLVKSNIKINGRLRFAGVSGNNKKLNLGDKHLVFGELASVTGISNERFIKTNGNSGDLGITKKFNAANTSFNYPFGSISVNHGNAEYAPANLSINGTPTSYGEVNIVPVGSEHPSTTNKGNSLTYYWKVKSTGFTLGAASFNLGFTYSQNDVVTRGTSVSENGYVSAKFDFSTFTWTKGSINDVDEGKNIIGEPSAGSFMKNMKQIDGHYTTGDDSPSDPFGTPLVFTSIANGRWDRNTTWKTNKGAATRTPDSRDIVVVEGGFKVTLRKDEYCSALKIEKGSVLDIQTNSGSNFGTVVSHVSGNGTLRVAAEDVSGSTFEFPKGDFSDFNQNLGTTELYTTNATGGTTYWLPNGVYDYGNLILSPLGGSNIIFANNDVLIYGDLVTRGQDSRSWFCPTWDSDYPQVPYSKIAKTITINGNLKIDGGALVWIGNNNLSQDFIVKGDVVVSEQAGIIVWSNANNQTLTIEGSLINNALAPNDDWVWVGGRQFQINQYRGCNFTSIPLYFTGNKNASITNTVGSNTYTVIQEMTVDKGTSQKTELTCNIKGTFNTPVNNWLYLKNGTFKYERNNNLSITTTSDFIIPATAQLFINSNRSVYLSNSNSNADIKLDGKLSLINGNIHVGSPSHLNKTHNDIEYSGGGFSEIEVQNGELHVNGQIRRSPNMTSGILKYTQSGGKTIVHAKSAVNSHEMGDFEVVNPGSSFSMSGGILRLRNGGGLGVHGDLFLRPEKSNVTGGSIEFDAAPSTDQLFELESNIALPELRIRGNTSKSKVELLVSPLKINGDLIIEDANSNLDVNDRFNIPVNIKGDFVNNGTYNYHKNTTTFDGNSSQISGTSDINFYKLVVNSIVKLGLNKDANIEDDLEILKGTLECATHTINVQGNIVNNALYTNANTGGVHLNGRSLQYVSGNGGFGKLEINNNAGARLTTSILLYDDLVMTKGLFDINNYLLSLEEDVNIQGAPFSNKKMIISDGVYSNVGIKKIIGKDPITPVSLLFPLGSGSKYTPTTINYTMNSNKGFIRVNNINSAHPGVLDPNNVLQYFWEIEGDGLKNFDGTMILNYNKDDVKGGPEDKYVAAVIRSPWDNWSKTTTGAATDDVDEINHTITFHLPTSNISGEYTAGLEVAIPNDVPQYRSKADGDWNNRDNWEPTNGTTHPCPDGGPNGFIVYIDHEINANANYCYAYRTIINNKLKILKAHYGHKLGNVSGNGTLFLETGRIPAGRYSAFLACANNSTIEYGGNTDYTIIADLYSRIPNLYFTGSGRRGMPTKDLTICKHLLINGTSLDNSISNSTITIQGVLERTNTGRFISGDGKNATVVFQGSTKQSIAGTLGDFSGVNSFHNFKIDNANGLDINPNGSIQIKGKLNLSLGVIKTSSTEHLFISNTAEDAVNPIGGSTDSYINGPMTKRILQSGSFDFPIGKDGVLGNKIRLFSTRTETVDWTVEYFNSNPTYKDINSPLTYVNSKEHWEVSAPASNEARILLRWDSKSDITPVMTEHGLTDMRISRFDKTASNKWLEVISSATGTDASGNVSTNIRIPILGSEKFSIGCINVIKPRARFDSPGYICGYGGIPLSFTSTVPISLHYTLTYNIDGGADQTVSVNSLPYVLPANKAGVYKLKSFTYDNATKTGVVDLGEVNVREMPTTPTTGADRGKCGENKIQLQGNNPVIGTGLWEIISGAGGSFENAKIHNTNFSGASGTGYTLRWTISNEECSDFKDVKISFPYDPVTPAGFTVSSNQVCTGQKDVLFEIANDPTADSFTWTTDGIDWFSSPTNNQLTIDFGENATSGKVQVVAKNSCGESKALETIVTVNKSPEAINQTPATTCSEEAGEILKLSSIDLTTFHKEINKGTTPGADLEYTWYSDAALTKEILTPADVNINETFGGVIKATKVYYVKVKNKTTLCENKAQVNYTIYRVPVTGPTYHLKND